MLLLFVRLTIYKDALPGMYFSCHGSIKTLYLPIFTPLNYYQQSVLCEDRINTRFYQFMTIIPRNTSRISGGNAALWRPKMLLRLISQNRYLSIGLLYCHAYCRLMRFLCCAIMPEPRFLGSVPQNERKHACLSVHLSQSFAPKSLK